MIYKDKVQTDHRTSSTVTSYLSAARATPRRRSEPRAQVPRRQGLRLPAPSGHQGAHSQAESGEQRAAGSASPAFWLRTETREAGYTHIQDLHVWVMASRRLVSLPSISLRESISKVRTWGVLISSVSTSTMPTWAMPEGILKSS
jgi:hypothetical protein